MVITVAQQLLGAEGLTLIRTLMRNAAVAFDAVTGYVHVSGGAGSMQSPYERRISAVWKGERLDAMSRGMYWGSLIGAGHPAALGGPGRLEQLLTETAGSCTWNVGLSSRNSDGSSCRSARLAPATRTQRRSPPNYRKSCPADHRPSSPASRPSSRDNQ
jgi:hypothetical protein